MIANPVEKPALSLGGIREISDVFMAAAANSHTSDDKETSHFTRATHLFQRKTLETGLVYKCDNFGSRFIAHSHENPRVIDDAINICNPRERFGTNCLNFKNSDRRRRILDAVQRSVSGRF